MRLVREAYALADQGDLPGSAERLRRATEADPKWFEAWNNLGSRRVAMGQYKEAAEAFLTALAIDNNVAVAHSNLGLAYLFLRQPAAAEASATRALRLEPDSPHASYVVGMALLQQNKNEEEAVSRLRQTSKILPRALLSGSGVELQT